MWTPPPRVIAPWLRRVRLARPHELSPDLERMLLDRAPALANWTRLYDETLSRLVVRAGSRQSDAGRGAESVVGRGRRPPQTGGARTGQGAGAPRRRCSASASTPSRWRNRPRTAGASSPTRPPRAISPTKSTPKSVAALEAAVVEHYPSISHRYYALKARLMGKPVLDYWDRNAPLDAGAPRRYGWGEAKAMVLDAYAALTPAFADRARLFFDQPWIDARPRTGKSVGRLFAPGHRRSAPIRVPELYGRAARRADPGP